MRTLKQARKVVKVLWEIGGNKLIGIQGDFLEEVALKLDLERNVSAARPPGIHKSSQGHSWCSACPGFSAYLPGEARELKHLRTQGLIHITDHDLILTARATRWSWRVEEYNKHSYLFTDSWGKQPAFSSFWARTSSPIELCFPSLLFSKPQCPAKHSPCGAWHMGIWQVLGT